MAEMTKPLKKNSELVKGSQRRKESALQEIGLCGEGCGSAGVSGDRQTVDGAVRANADKQMEEPGGGSRGGDPGCGLSVIKEQ